MGLIIKDITLDSGLHIDEGYFKLTLVSYNVEAKEASYGGAIFVSKDMADDGYQPIDGLRFSGSFKCDDKNVNLYDKCYEYVKNEIIKVKDLTAEQIEINNQQLMNAIDEGYMGLVESLVDSKYLYMRKFTDIFE